MTDVVIVDAVRTPVGRRGGQLASIHPADLSAHVLRALAERTDLDPSIVDDVIWGCVGQAGEQSTNIARTAVLAAGWPQEVPATTVDRQCGSSQQALHFAAAGILAGHYDVAVAGGVESMSRVPLGASAADGPGHPYPPSVLQRFGVAGFDQIRGAELIAQHWGVSRQECDAIALESHLRAAAATDEGRFANELAPLESTQETGGVAAVTQDEGVRRGGTPELMAGLRPVLGDGHIVTAGNASQISDGAAALLLTTAERARELGWQPLARVHTVALVGVDPVTMLTGPIPATIKVLDRAGLTLADIDHFEVNEAFAAVIGAWRREHHVDDDRLNPNGGAIALGHPLGGSGARLMTTMIHALRHGGGRYGLQTMCEGGGQANATLLEAL